MSLRSSSTAIGRVQRRPGGELAGIPAYIRPDSKSRIPRRYPSASGKSERKSHISLCPAPVSFAEAIGLTNRTRSKDRNKADVGCDAVEFGPETAVWMAKEAFSALHHDPGPGVLFCSQVYRNSKCLSGRGTSCAVPVMMTSVPKGTRGYCLVGRGGRFFSLLASGPEDNSCLFPSGAGICDRH